MATACSATEAGEYVGTRATLIPSCWQPRTSTRSKPAQRIATNLRDDPTNHAALYWHVHTLEDGSCVVQTCRALLAGISTSDELLDDACFLL